MKRKRVSRDTWKALTQLGIVDSLLSRHTQTLQKNCKYMTP